jgi:hypothetical protein
MPGRRPAGAAVAVAGTLCHVFHLQLRQFPHNHCQFNLSDDELQAIADGWVLGQWLTIGERQWSARQAKLTIIEGPRMPLAQLSMGRGWRRAQREGQDVTRQVLASTRARAGQGMAGRRAAASEAGAASKAAPHEAGGANADVFALLGGGAWATNLLAAWRSESERSPQLSPSERLALAEHQLRASSRRSGE